MPYEIDLDGRAGRWIIIDDENMRHSGSPRLGIELDGSDAPGS